MTEAMSEAELADFYDQTHDLSEFEGGAVEAVTVRRTVTISVRFSDDEMADLRARAGVAGVKVTSFIRAAALEASRPMDLTKLTALAQDLEKRAHAVAEMIARGVA